MTNAFRGIDDDLAVGPYNRDESARLDDGRSTGPSLLDGASSLLNEISYSNSTPSLLGGNGLSLLGGYAVDVESRIVPQGVLRPFKAIGETMHDTQAPDWLVEGFLAKGKFHILAGLPKQAKKSLVSMHMAIQLARGEPLFGLPTRPCRVMMMNLEDGYQLVLQRFFDFGIRVDDPMPLSILVDDTRFHEAIEVVKAYRPDVLIIDPLMEVELIMNVKNENDATQMGAVMKMIRTLTRQYDIFTLLLHHFGTKGDRARGSSVLQGSPDGWMDLRFLKKQNVHRLSWHTRYAIEGHVDLTITYGASGVKVDIASAPVFGDTGEGSNGKGDDDDEDGEVNADQYVRIVRVLQEATEPLTKDKIRELAKVERRAIAQYWPMLVQDDNIEQIDRRWRWRGKGEPGKGESGKSETVSSSAGLAKDNLVR